MTQLTIKIRQPLTYLSKGNRQSKFKLTRTQHIKTFKYRELNFLPSGQDVYEKNTQLNLIVIAAATPPTASLKIPWERKT